jgi:hypothetical protein
MVIGRLPDPVPLAEADDLAGAYAISDRFEVGATQTQDIHFLHQQQ